MLTPQPWRLLHRWAPARARIRASDRRARARLHAPVPRPGPLRRGGGRALGLCGAGVAGAAPAIRRAGREPGPEGGPRASARLSEPRAAISGPAACARAPTNHHTCTRPLQYLFKKDGGAAATRASPLRAAARRALFQARREAARRARARERRRGEPPRASGGAGERLRCGRASGGATATASSDRARGRAAARRRGRAAARASGGAGASPALHRHGAARRAAMDEPGTASSTASGLRASPSTGSVAGGSRA